MFKSIESGRSAQDARGQRFPRVLLVTEEPAALDGVEQLLEEDGFEAHWACDAAAAGRSLRMYEPDVVVLDLDMRSGTAIGFLRSLKVFDGKLSHPVITLTAREDTRLLSQCFDLGVSGFLGKPVDCRELFRSIRRAYLVRSVSKRAEKTLPGSTAPADTATALRDATTEFLRELRPAWRTFLSRVSRIIERDPASPTGLRYSNKIEMLRSLLLELEALGSPRDGSESREKALRYRPLAVNGVLT